MNKPERKRTTSTRRDYYTVVTLLTLIGTLIFRIPLGYLIGDKGIAYFGVANELYLVIAGTISYGLSEAVAILIRYRIRREQHKNAEKVLMDALFFGGITGLILSIAVVFFGPDIAEGLFHIPLAGMAVSLMAPAMFFFILTGIFRGYFQGNGSRIPAMHSQVLATIFLFVGGLLGATLLHGYGLKVSAFLQNEDYASAYGAMGASIGLFAASVFCFLHVLILFFVYRNRARRQAGRELQKNQDTRLQVLHMLIGTGAVYSFYWFCFHVLPLLDQYLFFRFAADTEHMNSHWGQYYGRSLVIIGIICGVINIVCMIPVRRIVISLEREEGRMAGERLGILIHQCAAIAIPTAVFLAVLAENILDLLFSGNQQQTVWILQIGSLVIVFHVFSSVFTEMLIKSRMMKFATGIGAIALIFHAGIAILLLKTMKTSILAVIISVAAFYMMVTILDFILISRSFQYSQEWIKSFAITIIASAIAGVAAMLLNKLLAPLTGMVISMVICIVAAVVLYLVLLVITRAFHKEELEEMPGGRILLMLSRLLRFS